MDQRALTELSDEQRNEALGRFYVIRPFLEDGVSLPKVAKEHGISVRTAQRWVDRYRTSGLVGLFRQERLDRGRPRCIVPDLRLLIECLALQRPRPSVAFIHRQTIEIARREGWKIPSYSSVYAYVRKLDPDLLTLAHEGSKVYKETFDLIYRREASCPNEIWQADHSPLDIVLLDDRGKAARPWLTVILDDFSRAIAGYYLSFERPCILHTALALRQAIWRKDDGRWRVCGIPDVFYTDRGSDFTSHHMEQVAADLKMQLIFSTVGEPRGRGRIERIFRTLNQLFLCELPGYSPEGGPRGTAALTLPQLDVKLMSFLLNVYHTRLYGTTGTAPQARWEDGAWLPRMPESLEQLDFLLITVAKTRRVHADGIRFEVLRYMDLSLAAYVGEEVIIRYDPRDMAELRVYHQNQFIGRAVCQEIADRRLSLKEIVSARNKRRRELRKSIAERQEAIHALMEARQGQDETAAATFNDSNTSASGLKRYLHE